MKPGGGKVDGTPLDPVAVWFMETATRSAQVLTETKTNKPLVQKQPQSVAVPAPGVRPGGCRLDATALKNMGSTFPRRAWLGNTDTFQILGGRWGAGLMNRVAVAACGDHVRVWGGDVASSTHETPLQLFLFLFLLTSC